MAGWELYILLFLLVIPRLHYEANRLQATELFLIDDRYITAWISPTHTYDNNYFCPKICRTEHTHYIHIDSYNCGVPNCTHLQYKLANNKMGF